MNKDFSIIIVNYNTYDDICSCLDSLRNLRINLSYEIIIVDNNSEDRRIETIIKKYSEVNLNLSSENKGFGNACNIGAKISKGKYYVFVNPDTIFNEDAFTSLFRYMEENDDTAVCTGILENMNKEPVYTYNYFPDIKWEFMEALGRGSHNRIQYLLSKSVIVNKLNMPFKADWVIGAFMFFRADVFNEIGGFDEDYFLYYEDVDIQKRVKALNYKIMVIPHVRIIHNERGSVRSFKGENLYYYHMMRSRMLYFSKNINYIKRLIIKIMHFYGIIGRMVFLPFRADFDGKKKQKYLQYKMMYKMLFKSKKKLIADNYSELTKINLLYKSNEIIKDKFWS